MPRSRYACHLFFNKRILFLAKLYGGFAVPTTTPTQTASVTTSSTSTVMASPSGTPTGPNSTGSVVPMIGLLLVAVTSVLFFNF